MREGTIVCNERRHHINKVIPLCFPSAEVSTRGCPTYELGFGDAMADGTIPSSRNIVQEEFEFLSCCLRIGNILERLVGKEDRHAHTYRVVGSNKANYERDEV